MPLAVGPLSGNVPPQPLADQLLHQRRPLKRHPRAHPRRPAATRTEESCTPSWKGCCCQMLTHPCHGCKRPSAHGKLLMIDAHVCATPFFHHTNLQGFVFFRLQARQQAAQQLVAVLLPSTLQTTARQSYTNCSLVTSTERRTAK